MQASRLQCLADTMAGHSAAALSLPSLRRSSLVSRFHSRGHFWEKRSLPFSPPWKAEGKRRRACPGSAETKRKPSGNAAAGARKRKAKKGGFSCPEPQGRQLRFWPTTVNNGQRPQALQPPSSVPHPPVPRRLRMFQKAFELFPTVHKVIITPIKPD